MLTGVLLAVARIAGETAPLLFTALNNQFWSTDLNAPMANLPVVIFQFAMSPYADWQTLAWGGALLITAAVLVLNISARAPRLLEQLQAMNSASHDRSTPSGTGAAPRPAQPRHDGALARRARRARRDRPARRRGQGRYPRRRVLLRNVQGAAEHHAAALRPARHRVYRPVGLRQVDPAAHPQPHLSSSIRVSARPARC